MKLTDKSDILAALDRWEPLNRALRSHDTLIEIGRRQWELESSLSLLRKSVSGYRASAILGDTEGNLDAHYKRASRAVYHANEALAWANAARRAREPHVLHNNP